MDLSSGSAFWVQGAICDEGDMMTYHGERDNQLHIILTKVEGVLLCRRSNHWYLMGKLNTVILSGQWGGLIKRALGLGSFNFRCHSGFIIQGQTRTYSRKDGRIFICIALKIHSCEEMGGLPSQVNIAVSGREGEEESSWLRFPFLH